MKRGSPQLLQQLLQQLRAALQAMPAQRYWVAYSGGIDSHVLLHAMAALRSQYTATLNAVHVNHGLNPAASEWAAHAVAVCETLDIPCHLFNVDAVAAPGESPEAAARDARYRAFAQLIERGDLLLTAHHQEDQSETLLLQLLRGAGPQGLAAMPVLRRLSAGQLARPLLSVSQAQIEQYAQDKSLQWVEDPSNQERGFERNYLRHEVIPSLKSHWPAFAKTVSRAAGHCAEAVTLLDEVAAEDLHQLSGWVSQQPVPMRLPLSGLQQMSPQRRRNTLRFWIRMTGLPIVSTEIMKQIEHSLIDAREDAIPLVQWPGGELRRYRDALYAMLPLAPLDTATVLQWQWPQQTLALPGGLGTLTATVDEAVTEAMPMAILSLAQCQQQPMTIRFRQGGERCQLVGREHHHTLKGLLQTAGVPPWQRDRIPLIYVGDQLAVVVGHFICAPFQAKVGGAGIAFSLS